MFSTSDGSFESPLICNIVRSQVLENHTDIDVSLPYHLGAMLNVISDMSHFFV